MVWNVQAVTLLLSIIRLGMLKLEGNTASKSILNLTLIQRSSSRSWYAVILQFNSKKFCSDFTWEPGLSCDLGTASGFWKSHMDTTLHPSWPDPRERYIYTRFCIPTAEAYDRILQDTDPPFLVYSVAAGNLGTQNNVCELLDGLHSLDFNTALHWTLSSSGRRL